MPNIVEVEAERSAVMDDDVDVECGASAAGALALSAPKELPSALKTFINGRGVCESDVQNK